MSILNSELFANASRSSCDWHGKPYKGANLHNLPAILISKLMHSSFPLPVIYTFFCLSARFFNAISSNIDEVLSIKLSANVFFFGDSNVPHKDLLTYSDGNDRAGKLLLWFFYLKRPALLNLFISSDASICSTVASHPLEILIKILPQFPLIFCETQRGNTPFHLHTLWLLLCWLGWFSC